MFLRFVLSSLLLLLLSGCAVTIDHTDVFLNRDRHVAAADVAVPASVTRTSVHEVVLTVGERRYLGYRLAADRPARAVLFLPGNGYGASRAVSRLAEAFHDAGTDVYLMSYYQPEESQPRVEQVFAMATALADHASATSGLPRSRLIAVGHSLGGWLALHLTGAPGVGCAVVVGSGTTAVATAQHLLQPAFLASALRLRSTPDVLLLDGERLASAARAPTLVIGSEKDETMPVARASAIFASLPAEVRRGLFVSPEATHGGYFRDAGVLGRIQAFMRDECAR